MSEKRGNALNSDTDTPSISRKKKSIHWDEAVIAEHDLER